MRTWREPAPEVEESRRRFETANDRFQRHYLALTAIGLLVATGLHFGLFALNPRMLVQAIESAGTESRRPDPSSRSQDPAASQVDRASGHPTRIGGTRR